jgi:hypothetical protein
MTTAGERVIGVSFTGDDLIVDFLDDGFGIHWPDVDEDLSTEGLLRGARAPGHTSSGTS